MRPYGLTISPKMYEIMFFATGYSHINQGWYYPKMETFSSSYEWRDEGRDKALWGHIGPPVLPRAR